MYLFKVRTTFLNKNALQWDAFRPLVDRIPACTVAGGVPAWAGVPAQGEVYLARRGGACPGTPPVDRQTTVKT